MLFEHVVDNPIGDCSEREAHWANTRMSRYILERQRNRGVIKALLIRTF
jgi:hypothetical protein